MGISVPAQMGRSATVSLRTDRLVSEGGVALVALVALIASVKAPRSVVNSRIGCALRTGLCVTALLLAGFTMVVVGAPTAGANTTATSTTHASASTGCSRIHRPDASFVAADAAGRFSLDVDLDANTAETIESTRLVARFRAVQAGFDADSVAAIDAYLDSIVAWYGYLDAPCAPAVAYPGPFTNAPEVPGAAFGFGGVEASTVPAVVMQILPPSNDADGESGGVVAASVVVEEGPALAHSGSESFVLAYFGAGLLAFGATALGMKRWMSGPM